MSRLFLALALLAPACSDTFECGGKALATVRTDQVCDGIVDCWGGQDERGECTTELFYCDQPEPQAVLMAVVCDGTDDCPSGVDEADCP